MYVHDLIILFKWFTYVAGEDFIPGQYNVTFSGYNTQATVHISLQVDNIDEETEYFMLYLYIPSAAYRLGARQGDIIKAVAIIFRPGKHIMYLQTVYVHNHVKISLQA